MTDRLLGDLQESCCSFLVEAIVFYVFWQEQHGGKKRAYVSEALVRRCLRSALLLVIGPVKVLARVTCRTTRQKNVLSATASHQRESTNWAPSRQPFTFQHPTLSQWNVQDQQSSLNARSYILRANTSIPPAPTSAFPFENFTSLLKSNKTYIFSLFSLSSEHLLGFNKPATTNKCYCHCFPGGTSHRPLSPSFRYLKDGAVERDIKGSSAVNKKWASTNKRWSIPSHTMR